MILFKQKSHKCNGSSFTNMGLVVLYDSKLHLFEILNCLSDKTNSLHMWAWDLEKIFWHLKDQTQLQPYFMPTHFQQNACLPMAGGLNNIYIQNLYPLPNLGLIKGFLWLTSIFASLPQMQVHDLNLWPDFSSYQDCCLEARCMPISVSVCLRRWIASLSGAADITWNMMMMLLWLEGQSCFQTTGWPC